LGNEDVKVPSNSASEAHITSAADEREPEVVHPAHLPAVLEGLAQAKRRQFAADDDVEAAFRRFDR
jgi:hypothetical protein